MVAFGVIGFLVLVLIFFVIRAQNLQREVALSRQTAKTNARRVGEAYTSLVHVCDELQRIYTSRLESAYAKRLINAADYPALRFVVGNFAPVITDCFEKGYKVEEALTRALKKHPDVSLEQIREVMKKQPSQVRLAWVQNTPDGYLQICAHLSQPALTTETGAEQPA